MSSNDGIYVGYWEIDGKKVYSVAYAAAVSNLYNYRNDQNYQSYVSSIWGVGDLFTDRVAALAVAQEKSNKTPTEYGVQELFHPFTSPPPERVKQAADFAIQCQNALKYPNKEAKAVAPLANKASSPAAADKEDALIFWMVYCPSGVVHDKAHYISRGVAQEAVKMYALDYPGHSFYVLEAKDEAKVDCVLRSL